jgi:beta-glucanase (GH16 family)
VKKLITATLTILTILVGVQSSAISAPKVTTKVAVKKITSIKPNSLSYFTVNEGFDYSGRLKQVYTSDNVTFNKNLIILEAFNDTTANPMYAEGIDDERVYTKSAPYSGGKLTLKDKFLYGRISFTAKFPNSPGTMPSFWLYDEVKSGPNKHYTEIDLLEIPGSEKGNMYSGIHWGIDYQSLKKDFKKRFVPNVATAFHKYDIYKTPNYVSIYVDGKLLNSITTSDKKLSNGVNGFKQPLNLIMNMNVGDVWGGEIDNTRFPHRFIIKDLVIENYKY